MTIKRDDNLQKKLKCKLLYTNEFYVVYQWKIRRYTLKCSIASGKKGMKRYDRE